MLFEPKDNLIDQSLSSRSAETPTNGDGFGLGWYGKWETPGLFKSIRPAWNDANFKVDGSADGSYDSKPSYATLTNGVSPSVHGLLDDAYSTTTSVDNIYNQLNVAGKSFKDYYEAEAGGCGVRFSGDYHDPIRYYTNVASICNAHDVPLSTFMADVNSGNLPAFSMILPTNQHNMHDNSISSGDAYAQTSWIHCSTHKRMPKAMWQFFSYGMRILPFRIFCLRHQSKQAL